MDGNRYQCWWMSDLTGWHCDGYSSPSRAQARLAEVKEREHFTRGVAIDMQEHLTSQESFPTQQEFDQRHRQFTEYITHV